MAETDRYRKLADAMADRIAAVPDGMWGRETPCEGWTARELVRHLVETQGNFFGLIDEPAPTGGPSVDDDPAGAFAHTRAAVLAALEDPAVAGKAYDGFTGRATIPKDLRN